MTMDLNTCNPVKSKIGEPKLKPDDWNNDAETVINHIYSQRIKSLHFKYFLLLQNSSFPGSIIFWINSLSK